MLLSTLLQDSPYNLKQFSPALVAKFEQSIFLKNSKNNDIHYVNCLVRNKEIKLTPEEIVRQLYLKVLIAELQYPVKRIALEHAISFGREKKRADIVIFDKDRPDVPYIIVELKKPKLKDGKEQLKSYCNATGAPIAVWTNGEQISYYHRKDPNYFEEISYIPNAAQKLSDVFNEQFSLEDLIAKDKKNTKSLKSRILEMEDEVLANAGVDVFEECFKLIFIKLFDEWESGRNRKRFLQFRNIGTEQELKDNIKSLFDAAKKKWHGVFSDDAEVELSFSHLPVCVSYLQDVKLFNSNLDVIDEAFEYLINKSSKGEKGQYFTPRYVIDMCVKMLNPQEHESMIDTAAGSAGFTMHTIFHVWRKILDSEGLMQSHLFTLEKKPARCEDYVTDKVFAIDFDEKAVRVARTLNLIAGDGETNVLHLNTLDYERWDETIKVKKWQKTYNNGWFKFEELAAKKEDFKPFNFDVLMANPPFAGDIKESRIIHKYELAQKNDKWQSKVGRDILFIERNLDFLKSGGRMAIVLPQGRFNNSSDKYIRNFISEKCRILAVVGLHGNTFKPHTGTKTSVLLVQKWDDKLCPKKEDYPIFFATMQKSGKDNSGEKIELKDSQGAFILDTHGHRIVEHDLFNHEGLTQDGIAETFIEFAKKEGLSFFELGGQALAGGQALPDSQAKLDLLSSFNEAKYQALLERLEISEVLFSKIDLKDRFDAEYFWKDSLHIQELLEQKNSIKFNKFGDFVASAFYPAATHLYEIGDMPFIRCVDCISYPFITNLQNDSFEKIPAEFAKEQSGISLLSKGDIVITKVGSPC
ncbi:MAG: hypothetical protein RL637_1437, partial [Pseudomonadota bacterium]